MAPFLFCFSGCQQPPDYTVPVAEKKEKVVRFCAMPGWVSPDMPADFEDRTGIRVAVETVESMDQVTAGVIANPMRWDVIMVRDYAVPFLREWRLLSALDFGRLPAFKNLDWRFLDQPFDPGSRYALPLTWGITVLAYRTDKINPPPSSWSVLWEERYAGKVMMPDDPHVGLALALLGLGFQPDSDAESELQSAGEAMVRQSPGVLAYGPADRRADALIEGSCWLAPMEGGEFAALLDPGDPVGWVVPVEGAPRWMDLLAIPRDAEHVEEAYALINYLMEPRPASQAAAHLMRATPNKGAESQVSTALRNNPLVYPDPDVLTRCHFIGWDHPTRRRVLTTAWLDIESPQPVTWAAPPVATNLSTP